MYLGLHVKYLFFLYDFKELNFLDRVLKNTNISNLMKICPVGPESFHAVRWMDRQTDMMKVKVALCNFVNAPKNQQLSVNKIGTDPVLGSQDIMGSV
jgi:hypothetical protein